MLRKLIIAAAVVLATAIQVPAQDNGGNYFGVRLSFDVMHPAGHSSGLNNGSGFTLKGIYNFSFARSWFLEPGVGVFYNTVGIKPVDVDDKLYDGSIRNFGLRIPVAAGYRFSIGDILDLAACTGPQFNVNLISKARLQPNFEGPAPTRSTDLFDYGWRRFDAQWMFGISATYAGSYYLGISGALGFTPMACFDTPGGPERIRRNTVSITLGYNF